MYDQNSPVLLMAADGLTLAALYPGRRGGIVGATNYKWPSINAKWKSGWKSQYKNPLAWFESFYPETKAELEHYASTGKTLLQKTGVNTSQYRQWESYVSIDLSSFALLKLCYLRLNRRLCANKCSTISRRSARTKRHALRI